MKMADEDDFIVSAHAGSSNMTSKRQASFDLENNNNTRPAAEAPQEPKSPFPDDTSDRGALFRAVLAEFLAMLIFVFLGTVRVTYRKKMR